MRDVVLYSLPSWAGFLVPTYQFMLTASLLIGCWWIVRRLQARGWPEVKALNALLWAVGGSLIGAKTIYLLQFGPGTLLNPLAAFAVTQSGYSLLGSLFGASLGAVVYLRWAGLSHAVFADACAP